jgi:hypothetical protein
MRASSETSSTNHAKAQVPLYTCRGRPRMSFGTLRAVLVGEIAKPESGRVAILGEATYDLGGRRFTLSAAPRVYPAVSAD